MVARVVNVRDWWRGREEAEMGGGDGDSGRD